MRRSIAVALGVATAMGIAMAPSAAFAAASSGRNAPGHQMAGGYDPNTTVTFTVTSGELTMTAPVTAALGSGAPGTTIDGVVSPITVTDDRAALNAAWTVTVAATDWTTGGGTAPETIPAGDATYDPGTITTTGDVTTAGSSITLSNSPQTVVSASDIDGDNTATWSAAVDVAVPAEAVSGTYTDTLTHSVS
jgi:hypothetical protein